MHTHTKHSGTTTESTAASIDTDQTPRLLTSTVVAAVLRVTGPVETRVIGHALGHPERQVSVRIGDAVIHLRDPRVAGLLRQRWDSALGSALQLREQVSQTWLRPRPGTYPVAVSVQLTGRSNVGHRFVPADPDRHQPAHVEFRVDQLVWQVCDQLAWRTIGNTWLIAYDQLR